MLLDRSVCECRYVVGVCLSIGVWFIRQKKNGGNMVVFYVLLFYDLKLLYVSGCFQFLGFYIILFE